LLQAFLRHYNGGEEGFRFFVAAGRQFHAAECGLQSTLSASTMPDQPQSERFKAEMPEIPGVAGSPSARQPLTANPAVLLVAGLLGVLLICFLGYRLLVRPKHTEAPSAATPPQLEVPAPAADPSAALPRSTAGAPDVATVAEMAKPWTTKDFFFANRLTDRNIPALLVRLPTGSATQPEGYWAFAMSAPFGTCQLEYLQDMAKLKNEYDFQSAKHPMVGNPCSRTVFDPLKMASVPGDMWVRGAVVQGSDLRPPLSIEIKIEAKSIQAVRME
jgi:hypothetical protein